MYKGSNKVDSPESLFDGGKKNKDTFYNKRAQFYIILAERFRKTYMAVEHGQYIDPDELISIKPNEFTQQLRAELCGIPRTPNLTGKIQLMPKKDMKKQLQRPSPNIADCFAMAMESPDVIETEKPVSFVGWA
jgi:phage terminase large subunit